MSACSASNSAPAAQAARPKESSSAHASSTHTDAAHTSNLTSSAVQSRRRVRTSGVMRECYGCRRDALVAALPSLRGAAREHTTLVQTLKRDRPSLRFPDLYRDLFLNGFASESASSTSTASMSNANTTYLPQHECAGQVKDNVGRPAIVPSDVVVVTQSAEAPPPTRPPEVSPAGSRLSENLNTA